MRRNCQCFDFWAKKKPCLFGGEGVLEGADVILDGLEVKVGEAGGDGGELQTAGVFLGSNAEKARKKSLKNIWIPVFELSFTPDPNRV